MKSLTYLGLQMSSIAKQIEDKYGDIFLAERVCKLELDIAKLTTEKAFYASSFVKFIDALAIVGKSAGNATNTAKSAVELLERLTHENVLLKENGNTNKIELEILREVYESARRVLRFNGVDKDRVNKAVIDLDNAIEQVKSFDAGNSEIYNSHSAF